MANTFGTPQMYAYGGAALVALGIGVAVYAFSRNPSSERPDMGVRGLKRKRALEEGGLFAAGEPLVRFLAGRLSGLPLDSARAAVGEKLTHAGDWLGLTPDEFFALTVLSTLGFAGVSFSTSALLDDVSPLLLMMILALGMVLPWLSLTSEVSRRFKQVNRGLPYAIDLASLAMGAGLDFPGALRQVTDKSPDKTDALYEELTRILAEIDLGRTRKQALEGFVDRCPTESVKDFVSSVVQSEEKGNPLSEVLNIQATMLRMRRSVAAEESAARAGLYMMGPLMLIFACIMLIILGPFIVNSITGKGGL